jgi:hypothetical protein
MENVVTKPEDYYETLVQNVQKGEMYSIKFKNDPVTYTGIPFIRQKSDSVHDPLFVFKVLGPDNHKGVHEKAVSEIEILERKPY